ncbi:hypothetical protein RFI_31307 [Reticulomyxa filosa]|uniref:Uncharacterized protein n=1 Tax=Reticulomyxa filosa TaxID=46433 RepID=X6LVX2_RETFI|nr:hypothetical protein RFI_31307 [Reticulomyxa filosa]|eukprot:ETO06088.1 hypothetical protein RFI_31307 [Reticulomyxa filosa]
MKIKDGVYVITRDDLAQSGYVSKTSEELSNVYDIDGKYEKQMLNDNQMTEVRLKDLRDFVQEADFFSYIVDNAKPTRYNVLAIACDAVTSDSMLMHYLHA